MYVLLDFPTMGGDGWDVALVYTSFGVAYPENARTGRESR